MANKDEGKEIIRNPYVLQGELSMMCRNEGCHEHINGVIELRSILKWDSTPLSHKIDCIKVLIDEYLLGAYAGLLLASLNLIDEYRTDVALNASTTRRRRQFLADNPHIELNGKSNTALHSYTKEAIEVLANSIIAAEKDNRLSTILSVLKKSDDNAISPPAESTSASDLPQTLKNEDIIMPHAGGSYTGDYILNPDTGRFVPHGRGKLSWNDGSFYVGEFVQGAKCGYGVLTTEEGYTVTANWIDNKIAGRIKVVDGTGAFFGCSDGDINKIEFNNGYIFDGTFNPNEIIGTLHHPEKQPGRFISKKGYGLRILSGDEDVRREILNFPHLHTKMIIFNDGRVYEGEMHDDKPHGFGHLIFPNNLALEANFDMGEVSRGLWVFPNGESIECSWKNNSWYGSRTVGDITAEIILSPDGEIASVKKVNSDGSWEELVESVPETRYVRILYSDGSEYSGDYNWLISSGYARGVLTDSAGAVWDGEWVDGLKNGSFTVTSPCGSISSTTYRNDITTGHCITTLPNGEVHEYEWSGHNIVGSETKITFPDKSVYEGDTTMGCPNGQGILTLLDGTMYSGQWINGRFNDSGHCFDLVKMWWSGVE